MRELARDRVSFLPGSAARPLIRPVKSDDPAEYERLIEGAWVVRRDGWYYIFYSGDNCCGPKAHYATLLARSRSATGPFEKLRGAKGKSGNVILERRARWVAPGHNSVATDAGGRQWIVYHAVDARRPRTKPTDDVNSRRVMLIDRLVWRGGWPRVANDGPSDGARPRPAAKP